MAKTDNPFKSLEEFLNQFPEHFFTPSAPPEITYAGPEGYAPLDPTKSGSWRMIYSSGVPTGLAWTDWQEGFNINILHENDLSKALKTYPTSAKACQVEASWAYTTLDTFIARLDPDLNAKIGPQQEGVLTGAQDMF